MHCYYCNDERIIWEKDKFGMAICKPCPECNRNGREVARETKEVLASINGTDEASKRLRAYFGRKLERAVISN